MRMCYRGRRRESKAASTIAFPERLTATFVPSDSSTARVPLSWTSRTSSTFTVAGAVDTKEVARIQACFEGRQRNTDHVPAAPGVNPHVIVPGLDPHDVGRLDHDRPIVMFEREPLQIPVLGGLRE